MIFFHDKYFQKNKVTKRHNLSQFYFSGVFSDYCKFRLKTSRDSYGTTLKRSGKSRDEIEEMMGHSTSQVIEHYLASLDMDKTCEINEGLFQT